MSDKNILVAVSDKFLGNLLKRTILTPAGFNVTLVSNVDNIESYLAKTNHNLMIIDEEFADREGLNLASRINHSHPELPVILLLRNSDKENIVRAYETGAIQCLCLPTKKDDVLSAVERARKRGQQLTNWAKLLYRKNTDYLQKRVDILEQLSKIGRSVTASLDIDQVLSSVVDAAVNLTESEEGSLLLVDEKSGELYMRAGKNFKDEFVQTFRLPINDTLAGKVIRTGELVEINADAPQKIKTTYLVKSLIYVPLVIHGLVIGVLGVDNRSNSSAYSTLHISILKTLAEYAVIAIENARLYNDSENERRQLETILTNVEDGVIVVGLDRRLILVNHTVQEAFQIEDKKIIGGTIEDVFQGTPILEMLKSHMGDYNYRDEIMLEDGRVFNALLTSIEDVGVIVAMQDITHLKELDRIKTDFVNTVSHDLRSPLTAILGYVELIERAGEINQQQREFVRRVQLSVRNITELINDLLDLGRIESGFDTRKEVVQILPIINFTLENFRNQIIEKNLKLDLSAEPELPKIFGDTTRLRQMMDNLVGNAIKYTPEGGKIQVSAHEENEQLIIRISDNGPGIPPADQPYIFDKFYRAGNVSNNISGTGLGLAIVKSIVENHQGRIWVDSSLGKGSKFTVVLPIIESETYN